MDSERYLADLIAHGAESVTDMRDADVVIVNTCGFIDAAKQESIDSILDAARLKESGQCQAVIAIGCMIERHKAELLEALPEVDLFLGSSETDRLLPELVARGLIGGSIVEHPGVRVFGGGNAAVRYLKVSEGCDHGCAFCAIPLMRGKHRSFGLDELVREAQLLELQGARELNLVAQDLAHYGRDRRDGVTLPDLLETLVRETSIPWLRNLYLYSAGITPRLLDVIAANPRIVRYLDTPMQHGADAVLARMRRPERQRTIREKVRMYRDAVPDLAMRTTVIVGFPGETEDDFNTLLMFLEEIQFDRVGVFTYSPQEGTRANDMLDNVPQLLKNERQERVQELQRAITGERYERFTQRVAQVMVVGPSTEAGMLECRAPWQADDIDGVTRVRVDAGFGGIVHSGGPPGVVPVGSLLDVHIDHVVDDYDFHASLLRVASEPAAMLSGSGKRTARNLPLMAEANVSSAGSFGR
ncbi:MAG: 30S ribosomal protein S12 methylthiotransferase RimO [Phycisphaerae bacterium]|nr:30S ribosomal protein S12 methylthiotransferase RimO [Gemmatimonadaceae bacterium]